MYCEYCVIMIMSFVKAYFRVLNFSVFRAKPMRFSLRACELKPALNSRLPRPCWPGSPVPLTGYGYGHGHVATAFRPTFRP